MMFLDGWQPTPLHIAMHDIGLAFNFDDFLYNAKMGLKAMF
jgi:hypothetical protein